MIKTMTSKWPPDPIPSPRHPLECKINALIQQLAWYYQVNDCAERRADDALDVPIRDLRIAAEIARELGLPDGPA